MGQELVEQWQTEFQTASIDRIKVLLSQASELANVRINHTTPKGRVDGNTPLFEASNCREDLELVRVLVESGADLKNCRRGTHWPSEKYEINAYLIKKGVEVNQPSYLGFHAMGVTGLDTFFLIMENGMDINYAWPHNGETLLHVTAREDRDDHLAKAYTLIKAGANVNAVTLSGLDDEPIMENEHFVRYGKETPLHFAARLGSIQMVRLFLAHGADPIMKTVSRIVEPEAFEKWTTEVLTPGLVGKEPRRMVFEEYEGESPRDMAIREGHTEIAEILHKHRQT